MLFFENKINRLPYKNNLSFLLHIDLSLTFKIPFIVFCENHQLFCFRSPVRTPKEDKEDWKLFQSLTSGVDSLIQEKKSKLEELKQESYFQKKQSQPEEDRDKGAKKKEREREREKREREYLKGDLTGVAALDKS